MDDLKQRDLSNIPESELTQEERNELRRRFEEFVGILRRRSGAPAVEAPAKRIQRWDPAAMARRHSALG